MTYETLQHFNIAKLTTSELTKQPHEGYKTHRTFGLKL
jgi:hypothetical protein